MRGCSRLRSLGGEDLFLGDPAFLPQSSRHSNGAVIRDPSLEMAPLPRERAFPDQTPSPMDVLHGRPGRGRSSSSSPDAWMVRDPTSHHHPRATPDRMQRRCFQVASLGYMMCRAVEPLFLRDLQDLQSIRTDIHDGFSMSHLISWRLLCRFVGAARKQKVEKRIFRLE